MIEINWSEINPKYKFAATDANGDVYVYENKPDTWYMGKWIAMDGGSLKLVDGSGNWLNSRQERP